jgi:hypothetical protein
MLVFLARGQSKDILGEFMIVFYTHLFLVFDLDIIPVLYWVICSCVYLINDRDCISLFLACLCGDANVQRRTMELQ